MTWCKRLELESKKINHALQRNRVCNSFRDLFHSHKRQLGEEKKSCIVLLMENEIENKKTKG